MTSSAPATLARQNPQSHRAFNQLGTLLAMTAEDTAGLAEVRDALDREG